MLTNSAPTLEEIQTLFRQAVFENDVAARSQLLPLIAGCKESTATKRLAIYTGNIRAAHHSALASAYPVCENLVGEDYFRQLANGYLTAYPPKTQDLNRYGDRFCEFLQCIVDTRSEASALVYLPDVALLEWRFHSAYYAKDDPPFNFEAFSRLAYKEKAESVFSLNTSLSLHTSPFPVLKIWRANREGSNASINLEESGNLDECGTTLVVWRHDMFPTVEEVDSELLSLLDSVQRRLPLHAIVNQLNKPERFPRLLAEIIQKRWIVGWLYSPRVSTSN